MERLRPLYVARSPTGTPPVRNRLRQLAAALLGWRLGATQPIAVQCLTLTTVVLLVTLAVLTHLCDRVLRLLFPRSPFPPIPARTGPPLADGLRQPTAAERRLREWLAHTRPPNTGSPRYGRRPDHPDGLLQDPAAPP